MDRAEERGLDATPSAIFACMKLSQQLPASRKDDRRKSRHGNQVAAIEEKKKVIHS